MNWLKEIRKRRGMTQEQVARLAGEMSRGCYANIETGQRRPSVKAAKQIAEVLGFPWTEFFEDAAEKDGTATDD